MIPVLLIVPMIARSFLRAMRWIVGGIAVQQNPLWHAIGPALAQRERAEGQGDSVTITRRDRVLQAGEGRLAGAEGVGLRQPSADEFEQGVVAEGVSVVLVFVATGDLLDALANQHRKRRGAGFTSPVRDMGGDLGTDTAFRVGSGQPCQPTVRGEVTTIEGGFEGKGREGVKRVRECGRIGHEEASSVDRVSATRPYRMRLLLHKTRL